MRLLLLSSLAFFLVSHAQAQLTQTVRGTIIDTDSKTPLIGAKVIIVGTDPLQGSITDVDGNFKIEKVAVGRITLKITSVGYQELMLPGTLVESGKELVLNIEMTEDLKTLNTVNISAEQDNSESINKMASVSGQMFTVDETQRYAGAINDPARMVSAFAGVTGDAEGDNDIVVRGNSPKGILWRLEGIDIPNPNHYADEGGSGGPVNALNASMLANSDFFSGAFAPEYGNAYSGVFDVRFRQGNNETREYTFSLGVMGTEFTLEGPFKVGYAGSYLINYRYSTIAMLDKLGILDFNGIPKYQDASFKIVLPTKKLGSFSLIGLGGISTIYQTDEDEEKEIIYGTYDYNANLGVVGLKHTYFFNEKTHLKSFIAATTSSSGGEGEFLSSDSTSFYVFEKQKFTDNRIKFASTLNHKFNAKHNLQVGGIYTLLNYNMTLDQDFQNSGSLFSVINSDGISGMMQAFASWKYRANNKLTLISGAHYTHFLLNNNFAIEPRLGMKWQINPSHSLSFGAGLHSRIEGLSTYLYQEEKSDGSTWQPNKNIDLTRAAHFVAGYGLQVTENIRFKTEVYYQHLYNIPVDSDTDSYLSLINFASWFPDMPLVNKGTGRNYGIELTLERSFQNGYYFLTTGSIYKSRYTALDGIERNTRFDAGYAANLLFGKEFKIGEKKNNVIAVNLKTSLIGGNRYTPIDLEASQNAGQTVLQNNPYSAKGDDIFFVNLGITYRLDKPRASHSIKIDIQNLTNNQARVREYYNDRTKQIDYSTQLPFIPNLVYTIKF